MEPFVWGAVIFAAALHASWNALGKGIHDPVSGMALVQAGTIFFTLPALLFFGLPEVQSLPYLGLSVVIHVAYVLVLAKAYDVGDLSHIYPLARGSAPLIILAFGALFLDETLRIETYPGLLLISGGLLGLSFARGHGSKLAVALALLTGLMIALYSLVDAIGARTDGNPGRYIAWLLCIDGIISYSVFVMWRKHQVLEATRTHWMVALIGGFMSIASYWIVLWAFQQSSVALVAALREVSLVFALILGYFWLNEPLSKRRVYAALAVTAGAIALRVF